MHVSRAGRTLAKTAPAMVPPVVYAVGLHIGVAFALAAGGLAALLGLLLERRVSGRMRWSVLGIVGLALSLALVLLSGNAALFLIRSVALRGLTGVVLIGSVLAGRPLAGILADWLDIPRAVVEEHRTAFTHVTVAWGVVEVIKAVIRALALATGSIDRFAMVLIATGLPVEALLVFASIRYLSASGVSLVAMEART